MSNKLFQKLKNFNYAVLPITLWASLGFYRGIKYYEYDYKEELRRYEEKKYITIPKPEKYYITQFSSGLLYACGYVLPIFCILPAIKELYRLEINIRGLEDKKNDRDYYAFFI